MMAYPCDKHNEDFPLWWTRFSRFEQVIIKNPYVEELDYKSVWTVVEATVWTF